MTPLYAGLMCTLLLSGTVAGLFGCMSAVRCHRPFVFAICLTIVSLDFAALAMFLSRLPESAALSPAPWTAAALLLTLLSLSSLLLLRRKSRRSFRRFPSRKAVTICQARCVLRGKTVSPA